MFFLTNGVLCWYSYVICKPCNYVRQLVIFSTVLCEDIVKSKIFLNFILWTVSKLNLFNNFVRKPIRSPQASGARIGTTKNDVARCIWHAIFSKSGTRKLWSTQRPGFTDPHLLCTTLQRYPSSNRNNGKMFLTGFLAVFLSDFF